MLVRKLILVVLLFFLVVSITSFAQEKNGVSLFSQFGVNLAGAEFGQIPGILHQDYIYPDCNDLKRWSDQEIRLIRYPIRFERIIKNGQLTAEFDHVRQILDCALETNTHLILDLHNYGILVDGNIEQPFTLGNLFFFWSQIVRQVNNHPALAAYGLMNEPNNMENGWPEMAQAAIDIIRIYDRSTPIMIAGECWSKANLWQICEKNKKLLELKDPNQSLIFEAHLYFDPDSSGLYHCQDQACDIYPGLVAERLDPFISWCKQYEVQCFVGEIGVPVADPVWQPVFQEAIQILHKNRIGATVWAAGPWWQDYPLSLEKPESDWIIDLIRLLNNN